MSSTPPTNHTQPFGKTATGENAHLYTLTNANGLSASITDFGARLVRLSVPDVYGNLADVVLGFDDVEDYQSAKDQSFGATIGPVAGRIGGARFKLDGKTYSLDANQNGNTLHSGRIRPMQSVLWHVSDPGERGVPAPQTPSSLPVAGSRVDLAYDRPDGEGGFPGNVHVHHTYTLTDDNALRLDYTATTDQPTPIVMTNHSYFNLGGHGEGLIEDHVLRIAASRYTPWNEQFVPTGELASVAGEAVDFRAPAAVGTRLEEVKAQATAGYDHYLVLDKPADRLAFAASVFDPGSGRLMEVFTTEAGLVLYSGNHLKSQVGKGGKTYRPQGALCLEAQGYPGALGHGHFPSVIVRPGEVYRQTTVYRFSAVPARKL